MLLSRNLLAKINNNFSNVSDEQLSNALNAVGIEVERIIYSNVNKNLRLGRLIDFRSHPDSDRLNICNVVVDDKPMEVVCGANDLKVNQWVVVALPGVEIRPGVIINAKEIRGVYSNGMLCSLKEILGETAKYISENDAKTIIQIPYNNKINPHNFFDEFGFNDTIFDLSIPSNRPELNGIYFLANELNLQFNFTTKVIFPYSCCFTKLFKSKEKDYTVAIDSSWKLAYSLLGLKINPNLEQLWKLKLSLINSGVKVQDNFTDYANFISTLFAQPVLCLNKNKVGNKISITELKEATEFTVNDKTIKLAPGTIVTKNSENEIVSLTGMYINKEFVANWETNDVLFELANLPTDYILEMNNKNNYNDAIASYYLKAPANDIIGICTNWLKRNNLLGKTVTDLKVIHDYKTEKPKTIYFKPDSLFKLLGIKLSKKQLFYTFKRIGILYLGYKAVIPSYRKDINTIADLAEELLKSIDINKLPVKPVKFFMNSFTHNEKIDHLNEVRNFLVNKQFYEVKTYNLTSSKTLNMYNWFNIEENFEVKNAISSDKQFLRNNLVNEMLEVLSYNNQHKQQLLNIFEIQKIHFDIDHSHDVLCCLVTEDIFKNPLDNSVVNNSTYTIKSLFDALSDNLGLNLKREYNSSNFASVEHVNNFSLSYEEHFVGLVGKLDSNILSEKYKLNNAVYFICLDLDVAFKSIKSNGAIYNKLSELNPIYKDITFTNPDKINLENITDKLLAIDLITNVDLIDVFTKDDNKSYTISLKIQPRDKNLTNDEINHLFQKAIDTLKHEGLVVRN